MKKRDRIIITVQCVVALLCACTSPTSTANTAGNVIALSQIKFGNTDVAGWTLDSTHGYTEYSTSNAFYAAVNGAGKKFVDSGMVRAAIQFVEHGDSICKIWILDFGTAAKATNVYRMRLNDVTKPVLSPSFSQDVAMVDTSSMYGNMTFGHFQQFYCEFTFSSFSSCLESVDASDKFLKSFQTKIAAVK